ncbi:MAG: zf-TFIIB domain-containing protein [Planctomycetes bacterium]|nr:zf-TFIIB domain-containing protein [Planctomycetota bacterium]
MCPACKEPMVVFELDGVEIDRCLKCSGTWLDAGELDQLARLQGGAPDRLGAAIAQADGGRKGERRCARCAARMRVVTVNGVEFDRCPRGHGLWFDRSEMETLIASFQGGEGGATARLLGELRPSKSAKGG